jgi:hypothetical protein
MELCIRVLRYKLLYLALFSNGIEMDGFRCSISNSYLRDDISNASSVRLTVNYEFRRLWKPSWPVLLMICIKPPQNCWPPSREINPIPPENKGVLTTQLLYFASLSSV